MQPRAWSCDVEAVARWGGGKDGGEGVTTKKNHNDKKWLRRRRFSNFVSYVSYLAQPVQREILPKQFVVPF